MAALESAIERLQKRVYDRRANPAGSIPQSPIRTIGRERRNEVSLVNDLVNTMAFMSVNATARDFHGFTVTMSFSRLLLSASKASDLPKYGSTPLPPRYATSGPIQHYLQNIYVLLPFLSETDLMASVSRVYDQPKAATGFDKWCIRMVLAISAGASSQQCGDANHEIAMRHVGAALEHAGEVLHPGSITGVQAILLLVLYSLVDPEHFRSWYLIGMASRVMVDLGIHVEPSPELKIPKAMLELRRRVFYCVFALDRSISISLGRAFAFTDDSAPEVHLPADTEKGNASQVFLQSTKPSAYLFDIRRVQSVFYQSTRGSSRAEWSSAYAADYTKSILRDIDSWQSTIPSTLSQRHILYFTLEGLYTRILVLSPSIRLPMSKLPEEHKSQLFELTFEYMSRLLPPIQDVSWHPFVTYTDILRADVVGGQFVDLVQSNFDPLICSGLLLSPLTSSAQSQQQQSSISAPTPLDNCQRTTNCIHSVIEILDFARFRWNLGTLRSRFEVHSAVLLGKLYSRHQELSTLQGLTSTTANTTPSSHYSSPNMTQSIVSSSPQLQFHTSPPQPYQRTSVTQAPMQAFDFSSSQHYTNSSLPPLITQQYTSPPAQRYQQSPPPQQQQQQQRQPLQQQQKPQPRQQSVQPTTYSDTSSPPPVQLYRSHSAGTVESSYQPRPQQWQPPTLPQAATYGPDLTATNELSQDQPHILFPTSSLPRRSYEFLGGGGGAAGQGGTG